ncbi:MAG TPA: TonB-dependent receptor [Terriglobales bacterium]|nr:TonB-dependent receptor [Terriglobales bacterium]
MRIVRGIAVLVLITTAQLLVSQTGTSSIRGTVSDPSGRVIPDATVTLTNAATNAVRTTKTTDAGAYVFDFLPPATYRVTVEAQGFKKNVQQNVEAIIGKPNEVNVTLNIGTTNEVVEVTSSAQEALINTQDATLGNSFGSLQITQLPLEARAVVDLLSLQPGATREGYITGARADQSNVTLDGVDINNAESGNTDIPRSTNTLTLGGLATDRDDIINGPVLRLSSEATEEFRVTTANGNANQGRSSGAQINIVTKSGTNSFHGAASEFYRSRGFSANNWFNNHSTPTVPVPPLQRNTFEAAIGGPIVKNRLFFFYDYSGRRDAESLSEARTVPLASFVTGQGAFKYLYCTDAACSNTQQGSLTLNQLQQAYTQPGFATTGLNPIAISTLAAVAAKYPANDNTTGDLLNTAGFRFNAPTPVHLNSHTAKVDFNLTNKQNAFLRVQVQNDHQTQPQWLPGTISPVTWEHSWGLAAGHTWTISNNWVNNFRYGLTREAFTQPGDSNTNDTDFRFVFQPNGELHTLSQIVPVHNFTDDLSWVKGNHTIQFGGNVRLISNSRLDYINAFDFAEENPDYYAGGGQSVVNAFEKYLSTKGLAGGLGGQSLANTTEVLDAAAALIGRLTQYNADFTFNKSGALLPAGTPANRDFATQSYDEYVQDTWKIRPSLTLTAGLRYSLERPVYETHGYETQPTVPLGQYLQSRAAAGFAGSNYFAPITIASSGPANGGKPLYNWDKNNFQPRIALAWSPDNGKTSVRGGFSLNNDYFGEALAVDFDVNNALGYEQQFQDHANTFDIGATGKPLAPLFTGFGQDVRSLVQLAGGTVPSSLVLPATSPVFDGINNFGELIQQSLDSNLHSPTEYVWNFTLEREIGKGGLVSASYIGRAGRGLLMRHDVAQFTDLRDPKTGVDWYTAGTALEKLRQKGVDISQIPAMLPAKINQYFDDMFPPHLAGILNNYEFGPGQCDPTQTQGGFDCNWTNAQAFLGYQTPNVGFFSGNDWTDVQAEMDLALVGTDPTNGLGGPFPARFMQPQYGALSTWASQGISNYNALTFSFRQRLSSVTLDFNYTWSHSLDDASGLQTEAGFGNFQTNGAFVVNAFRQGANYANSDFDVRHNINADVVWDLPFGRGRALLGTSGRAVDAILGGWQLSSIFRFNTGLPTGVSPFDQEQWATNWEVQSNATPTAAIHTCPNKPANTAPSIFGGCDINQIYQTFRNAYPGEVGPRNYLRFPGYVDVDLGLSKSWKMPYNERHELQIRWDVFNVTNTQKLTGIADFSVAQDPALNQLSAPPDWGNFTTVQGAPRVMQLGARYSF